MHTGLAPRGRSRQASAPQTAPERSFLVYMPSAYTPSAPHKVVVLAPDTAMSSMDTLVNKQVAQAEHHNLLLLVLAPAPGGDGFEVGAEGQAGAARGVDDVSYTLAALRFLRARACVDPARVFCAGYSEGAALCAHLSSELSSLIAAFAAVSGLRYPEPNNATRPVPVLAFHGLADPVTPFEGGGHGPLWYAGVEDAALRWARHNGCGGGEGLPVEQSSILGDGVILEHYGDCAESADVRVYTVRGMGHVWPASQVQVDERAMGPAFNLFDANPIIFQFFHDHGEARAHVQAAAAALDGSDSRSSASTSPVALRAAPAAQEVGRRSGGEITSQAGSAVSPASSSPHTHLDLSSWSTLPAVVGAALLGLASVAVGALVWTLVAIVSRKRLDAGPRRAYPIQEVTA